MKTNRGHLLMMLATLAIGVSASAATYDLAAYVWPAYHPSPRWAELGLFPDGKGEWQNLYEYAKRVEDGKPAAKPLWGYVNEADPKVMERKIAAAVAAGVNVFIYDWYWYGGRPFLEEALNEGFLKASNCGRMKFYLMWANHNVTKLWDNSYGEQDKSDRVVWPSKVSDEDFRKIVRHWIDDYFKLPNYYRIGGKPVLMLYNTKLFVDWDGLDKAKERIAYLRDEAKKAGLPGVHLQVVAQDNLPRDLGIDSLTIYNWTYRCTEMFPKDIKDEIDYDTWGKLALQRFDEAREQADRMNIEFYPNLTCGWDTNARYPVANRMAIVHNCRPSAFERMAQAVKSWADRNLPPEAPRLITVNSWNEWTEGSYLEPDDRFGYEYLNALKRVFNNQ